MNYGEINIIRYGLRLKPILIIIIIGKRNTKNQRTLDRGNQEIWKYENIL
jgi:hypothetical protein